MVVATADEWNRCAGPRRSFSDIRADSPLTRPDGPPGHAATAIPHPNRKDSVAFGLRHPLTQPYCEA